MAATKKTATKKASTSASVTKEFSRMKFKEYVISKKRSGRYEVVTLKGKNVNGLDKARILVDAKLVQAGFPKDGAAPKAKAEAPPADEAPAA